MNSLLTIKSHHHIITINPLGAEITSWKIKGGEVIYQKTHQWKKQAPLLFPFVGNNNHSHLFLHDKKILFQRHGYCRDVVFTIEKQKEDKVILSYDIFQVEPNYPLVIKVTYHITKEGLIVNWEVLNNSLKESGFQLGWHPGFLLKAKNYDLKASNYESFYLDQNNFVTNKKFTIGKSLLKNFATQESLLIPSSRATITSPNHNIEIESNFDYIIFWHPRQSNFVCIEPWTSLCSQKNDSINLLQRDNIKIKSKEKKVFQTKVKIW